MYVLSVEFLREIAESSVDSKAVCKVCGWAATEIERLEAELSWIYANCELRDGDNVHVDSDDVQAAVAAKAAKEVNRE